jgi:hypothetical protein
MVCHVEAFQCIYVICKQGQFDFLPSYVYDFISVYFLNSLDKTLSTVLNRSSEDGYFSVVLYLTGNVSIFSPLKMMLAVHFHINILC